MSYSSSIPSDTAYTQLLGQAFYNFTYMEWGLLWTIVKLTNDDYSVLSMRETAGQIAKRFHSAIRNTMPPLPTPLQLDLEELHALFLAAINTRNKLLHAHPYTAPDGAQQLTYTGGIKWTPEDVLKAAIEFETVAGKVNGIFYGSLAELRS